MTSINIVSFYSTKPVEKDKLFMLSSVLKMPHYQDRFNAGTVGSSTGIIFSICQYMCLCTNLNVEGSVSFQTPLVDLLVHGWPDL